MRALDWLKELREAHIGPSSKEGTRLGIPSNSELRRWLNKGSVLINGEAPKAAEEIKFPIWQLVFFPTSTKNKTTLK